VWNVYQVIKQSLKATSKDRDKCLTRHRESTSMYSLTFRVCVITPRSMDKMERRTQQARRCYRWRGQSSPACAVCVCGMHAVCGGPGRLPLGSAFPVLP